MYMLAFKSGPVLWDSMKDLWVNVYSIRQTVVGDRADMLQCTLGFLSIL